MFKSTASLCNIHRASHLFTQIYNKVGLCRYVLLVSVNAFIYINRLTASLDVVLELQSMQANLF